MSAPPLEDWQVQLGDLLLGDDDPYGLVLPLTGLDELPDVRDDDSDRPGGHGQFSGTDYASGRTVELAIDVKPSATSYTDALAALRRILVIGAELDLWFKLPGQQPLRLTVKPRRRRIITDQQYVLGLPSAEVQLRAKDPWAYSAEHAGSTAMPEPGGGLVYPLTYPLTYGTAAVDGRVVLTNAGTAPSWPTYTVWGPIDAQGFELVDVATGRRLRYPYALAASSWLVIDTRRGRVLEQGTSPRRNRLTRAQWSPVPAGGSLITQITPLGSAQPGARLDVTWADTYQL